jgi:hypothetical protein
MHGLIKLLDPENVDKIMEQIGGLTHPKTDRFYEQIK